MRESIKKYFSLPSPTSVQPDLFSKRLYIIASFLLIFLPQLFNSYSEKEFDHSYRRADATGFNHSVAQKFFPFYYYTGKFPVSTFKENVSDYSKDSILKLVNENGNLLVNEKEHWARFGDYARIWLYYPKAIMNGNANEPGIRPTSRIILFLTLISILFVFYRLGWLLQGFILAFLVSSSPFYLYEVHTNQNIFGIVSLSFLLLLAWFLFPFSNSKFKFTYFLIPLTAGIYLGFMVNVRGEILPLLISSIFIGLFYTHWKWIHRLIYIVILILVFKLTDVGIKNHFENKFTEAREYVREKGGIPYDFPNTLGHPFWHPFFCGLGDYDTKYGYGLHDTVVYHFALNEITKRTGKKFIYPGITKYTMGEYYDTLQRYYKKPELVEGYEEVLKEKVLSDIKADPLWYLGILMKRANYILYNTSPLQFDFRYFIIPIPFSGYLSLLLLLLWIISKQRIWILSLIFCLPMALSGFLMFSGYNNSFMNTYHFISATFVITLIFKYKSFDRIVLNNFKNLVSVKKNQA